MRLSSEELKQKDEELDKEIAEFFIQIAKRTPTNWTPGEHAWYIGIRQRGELLASGGWY